MLKVLSKYWWLLALRGVLAILFGILAFIWPGLTLQALVILFGAYVLIDGIAAIVTGIRDREFNQRWWVLLLEGIVGVIFGILTFLWPQITAVVLLYFIAAWAVVTGIFEIFAAIRLREEIEGEWVLGLSGLASIIFGVLLMIWPASGLLALVWLIGAYAIVFGILMLYLGFKVRGYSDQMVGPRHA